MPLIKRREKHFSMNVKSIFRASNEATDQFRARGSARIALRARHVQAREAFRTTLCGHLPSPGATHGLAPAACIGTGERTAVMAIRWSKLPPSEHLFARISFARGSCGPVNNEIAC